MGFHKNVFFLSCNFMSILRDVGKGFNKRTSSGGVAFQPLHLLMQLQKKEKLWNKNDIFYSIIIISGTHNQAQAHDHNEEHQDQKPTPLWWSSSFLENEVWREVARAPCGGFPNATDNDVLPNTLQSALQSTQPIVQQAGLLNIFCQKGLNILWD